MLTPDLSKIKPSDVDNLRGLVLNMAFALYVEKWKWVEVNSRNVRKILWDEVPPDNSKINMSACRYVGDGLFTFTDLPCYDKSLAFLIEKSNGFNQRQRNLFIYYLKNTLGTDKRFAIANASAMNRCRAIVKVFVQLKREEERESSCSHQ